MMKSKRRARRGFTLTETLVALAIFSLLTVAVVSGVNAAVKVYRSVTAAAETQSLTSELTQTLSDELRYARNITTDGDGNVTGFDSDTFGQVTAVKAKDGEVVVVTAQTNEDDTNKTYDLLGSGSYSSGLEVSELSISCADGVFTVKIVISGGALSEDKTTTLSVRALNP